LRFLLKQPRIMTHIIHPDSPPTFLQFFIISIIFTINSNYMSFHKKYLKAQALRVKSKTYLIVNTRHYDSFIFRNALLSAYSEHGIHTFTFSPLSFRYFLRGVIFLLQILHLLLKILNMDIANHLRFSRILLYFIYLFQNWIQFL
jgi:hypothetical protein